MISHEDERRLTDAQSQWRRILTGQFSVLLSLRQHQELHLTPENLKHNVHVGDKLEQKPDHVTRFFGQNVNGLKLDQEGGDFTELCRMGKEIQADVMGITEHNVDSTQHYVNNLLHESLHSNVAPLQSKLTMGTTPITTEHIYKPGGTFVLSMGNVVARLIDTGSDEMGRWTYQSFAGSNDCTVTFVNAYQVCKKSDTQKGRSTAAAQQESLLRQRGTSDPKPRKHFRKDLLAFLKTLAQAKHDILLLGDFNEELGEDEYGMSKICSEIGLIDLMHHRHGHMEVATYSRGKKRLDYPLGTVRVADSLVGCGYEPFHYRLFSDHRGYHLDFDTYRLFGSDTPSLPPMAFRDIQSKSPKQVTKYLTVLHKHLTSRNCFRRIDELCAAPEPNPELAERVDEDLRQFSISAAGQCRRFREPQWSRKLDAARTKVNVLKRALSVLLVGYDVGDQIRQIQAEHGMEFLIPESKAECQSELRKTQVLVRKIARDSVKTRMEELENRMTDLYLSPKTSDSQKLKILKHIKKAEALRRMFKKLGYLRKEKGQTAINMVEIPVDPTANPKEVDLTDSTKWRSIKVPIEIERILTRRNRKHFGQADGPWLQPPLSQQVDFTASTVTSELILNGEYDASELDEITQLMIDNLSINDQQADTLPLLITDEAFVSKLKNWKESTSTSPEGLHLGHWKALIARHEFSNDPKSDQCMEMDSMQQEIRRARLQLLNYSLKWGYSFSRWKNIVNVMIVKDPGQFKIHRLRVIHLYDAGYNLILGIKWRALMHHAIDKKLLNPGQYGRPGGSPMEPVFIEEMENEISRASRKSMVKFDNDATSCYDRILASIASITSRKFGLHKNVAFVMARTLEEAKYKLKTALGVTDSFYQHCELFPIHGTGQGSQNSPAIWCIISSVLFDCFKTKAHGATFESPDRKQSITIYMVGFVDDSTGGVNKFCAIIQPNPEELLGLMRADAQLWNDLLWVSAGALELPKCSYHVVHYNFTNEGAPVLQGGQVGPDLVLSSGDRSLTQKIPPLSAYSAHKTLGHFKDPAGNQNKQYEKLKAKSDAAGLFVQCSPLDRTDAWTYYYSVYLTSVGYPLPNCFFSFKELDTIQRKASRAIFAKCGYNRNTKRAIIYGPTRLGGGHFKHMCTLQGTGQILLFLKTWRSSSQASTLLHIAVSWAQYAVGTGVSFLWDVTTELPHMEVKWLRSLRGYLRKVGGQLELDEPGILPLQRVHDEYIMTAIISSDRFNPSEITQLNYCRQFLQLLTISDLTTADGIHIDQDMLAGKMGKWSNTTKLHHFNQGRPNKKVWNLWLKANLLWSDGVRLHQPLGPWLVDSSAQRQQACAYFDSNDDSLYLQVPNGGFRRYSLDGEFFTNVSQAGEQVQIPPTALPTTMHINDEGMPEWSSPNLRSTIFHTPRGPPPGTFEEFLADLPPWESSLFHSLQLETDPFTLLDYLISEPFSCTSDGSVRFLREGSFGWALSLNNNTNLAHCSGPVFGSKPTSYRAEGYGLLSMIRFLIRLADYCQCRDNMNKCNMASDNLSLVDNVIARQLPSQLVDSMDPNAPDRSLHHMAQAQPSLVSDWDILNEIRLSLPLLHTTPKIKWVKGHQDNTQDYEDLPLLARLNVDADRFAGEFQDSYGAERPQVLRLPHNGVQLFLGGDTITYQEKSAIQFAETGPPLCEYIKETNKWSDKVMRSIDWDAHGTALHRGNSKRVHLTKLVHDLLPTNSYAYRFVEDRTSCCPTCTHDNEDRDHIIRCSHPSRVRWRTACIRAIREATLTTTQPDLRTILTDGLTAWFQGNDIDPAVYPAKFAKLIRQQSAIGWRQLFNGRMSSEWARIQDDYLHRQKLQSKTSTGLLWTTRIITILWKQFDAVWEMRNLVIHGHDQSTQANIKRAKAQNRVRRIYLQRQNMLPRDRDFLFDTVDEHITMPTTALLNWLSTYQPLFKDSIKRAKKNAIDKVKAINQHFVSLGKRNKKKKKTTNESTNATDAPR